MFLFCYLLLSLLCQTGFPNWLFQQTVIAPNHFQRQKENRSRKTISSVERVKEKKKKKVLEKTQHVDKFCCFIASCHCATYLLLFFAHWLCTIRFIAVHNVYFTWSLCNRKIWFCAYKHSQPSALARSFYEWNGNIIYHVKVDLLTYLIFFLFAYSTLLDWQSYVCVCTSMPYSNRAKIQCLLLYLCCCLALIFVVIFRAQLRNEKTLMEENKYVL